MHFWKKLSAFTLAAAMTVTMAACSDKPGEKKDGDDKDDNAVVYNGDFTIGVDKIAEEMGAGWNLGNQL